MHDRLGKVRPLVDHLSSKFSLLYDPSKDVAVDEAMIKFQGCTALKQYMPMKPIKSGITVWVLGDSTNGYFSRFQVYTGRQENRQVGFGRTRGEDSLKISSTSTTMCTLISSSPVCSC